MLKNHFPMRVVAYDADGVQRNVANIHDILELAKEKAERYNDDESKRFVTEAENFLTPIKVEGAAEDAAPGTNNEGDTTGGEGTAKVDETKVATAKKPAAKKPAAKAAAKPSVSAKKAARKR